jgi:hypothetical protein
MNRASVFGFLFFMLVSTLPASILFTLDPPDGALSGVPGAIIGWGFILTNDTDYLVVSAAHFVTNNDVGMFTDFISMMPFTVVGPSGLYAQQTWAAPFDATAMTGLGQYVIDSPAVPGSLASGYIELQYDLFSVSPLDPNFNVDTDWIRSAVYGSPPSASAFVLSPAVPEPRPLAPVGAGLLVVIGMRIYRSKSSVTQLGLAGVYCQLQGS